MQIPSKRTGLVSPLLRGDIYIVNLDPVVGSEIGKARPALIIQNNIGNKYSPVTIVAPISSTKEITKPLPIMAFVSKGEGGLIEDSYIDCGQIRTVDKTSRLVHQLGNLNKDIMGQVDRSLKVSLDLVDRNIV